MNAVKKAHTIRFNVRGKRQKADKARSSPMESYLLHVPKGKNVSIQISPLNIDVLLNNVQIGIYLKVFDGDNLTSVCKMTSYFLRGSSEVLPRAVRKKLRKRGWTKVAGTGERNEIWLPPQTK